MDEGCSDLRFSRVPISGINLHVAEAGPPSGPLLILLHGFPEAGFAWRYYYPILAAAGFHVVMPDQRGYNLSDKPPGIDAYDLDQMIADVAALGDHFGQPRFSLVGHDWGASVGWWLASRAPKRLHKLVVLNAPHPAVWQDAMRRDPEQRRKSWYVKLFALPWLPELMLRSGRFRGLVQSLNDPARPRLFSPAEIARYREAWARPGALTAMVNWYRALLRKRFAPIADYGIEVPTLVIWGRRDAFAIPALAERSVALCGAGRLVYLDEATHWVQHDEPERVAALLQDFLT